MSKINSEYQLIQTLTQQFDRSFGLENQEIEPASWDKFWEKVDARCPKFGNSPEILDSLNRYLVTNTTTWVHLTHQLDDKQGGVDLATVNKTARTLLDGLGEPFDKEKFDSPSEQLVSAIFNSLYTGSSLTQKQALINLVKASQKEWTVPSRIEMIAYRVTKAAGELLKHPHIKLMVFLIAFIFGFLVPVGIIENLLRSHPLARLALAGLAFVLLLIGVTRPLTFCVNILWDTQSDIGKVIGESSDRRMNTKMEIESLRAYHIWMEITEKARRDGIPKTIPA